MAEETVRRIRRLVVESSLAEGGSREELLELLDHLESEVRELEDEEVKDALRLTEETTARTVEAGEGDDAAAKEDAVQAVRGAVESFEARHPELAKTITNLNHYLANLGI